MSTHKKPYSIRIFCKQKISGLQQLLEDFLNETSFFDEEPELTTKGDGTELKYETGKSPVKMSIHDKDDYFEKEIRELLFVLHLPAQTEKKAKMRELLGEFENLLLLTFQRDELTDDDDVWEFLDVFEAHIATRFDGIIHTDDQTFYDKKLKKIYKL